MVGAVVGVRMAVVGMTVGAGARQAGVATTREVAAAAAVAVAAAVSASVAGGPPAGVD
jgi:hypothetical protein